MLAAGETPLIWAAIHGRALIVDFLLEAGADLHRRDATGRTALDHALERQHAHVVRRLKHPR